MKKGWKQTWKNLLFQHFEIEDINAFNKYLPKDCSFDSFDGKFYLGLVLMNMTDVRHNSFDKFVWFKNYNELNVRTYIKYKNKAGVLFLSLDVDSLISILGARLLYGLPYRYRTYKKDENKCKVFKNSKLEFDVDYTIGTQEKTYSKDRFAHWATERYFFASKYLNNSFIGKISHKPWKLYEAKAVNNNLKVLDNYNIKKRHPNVLFCKQIDVCTGSLEKI